MATKHPPCVPGSPLTARQRRVYDLVERYYLTNGSRPTLRELTVALGVSSANGTVCHLKALVKKAWLKQVATHTAGGSRQYVPVGLRITVVRPDGTTGGTK